MSVAEIRREESKWGVYERRRNVREPTERKWEKMQGQDSESNAGKFQTYENGIFPLKSAHISTEISRAEIADIFRGIWGGAGFAH